MQLKAAHHARFRRLDVIESTRTLKINTAVPLVLLGGVLVSRGKRHAVVELTQDEEEGISILRFEEEIEKGEAVLVLRWEGLFEKDKMNGRLRVGLLIHVRVADQTPTGYYRVNTDQDEENEDFFAVTQFQPITARKAFVCCSPRLHRIITDPALAWQPCFDHPAEKATFSISLLSPVGYHSLSNMPESPRRPSSGSFTPYEHATTEFLEGKEGKLAESTVARNCETTEWELVEFKTTPKMSTYLVAWAVGRFE